MVNTKPTGVAYADPLLEVGTEFAPAVAANTTALSNLTFTAPGTPDYAIQDLVHSNNFGFVTKDEGNTVISVVKNLQTRVSELETKLATYGILP